MATRWRHAVFSSARHRTPEEEPWPSVGLTGTPVETRHAVVCLGDCRNRRHAKNVWC